MLCNSNVLSTLVYLLKMATWEKRQADLKCLMWLLHMHQHNMVIENL